MEGIERVSDFVAPRHRVRSGVAYSQFPLLNSLSDHRAEICMFAELFEGYFFTFFLSVLSLLLWSFEGTETGRKNLQKSA